MKIVLRRTTNAFDIWQLVLNGDKRFQFHSWWYWMHTSTSIREAFAGGYMPRWGDGNAP